MTARFVPALLGLLLLGSAHCARDMPSASDAGDKVNNLYTLPPPGPTDGLAPQNCTFGDGLGATWVEITNTMTYDQYASTSDGYTEEDLPDPLPAPYSGSTGQRFSAPAFEGICFARSPSAPVDCTEGVDCLVYMDNFNETWLEIAGLTCIGSYPTQGIIGDAAGAPPPGNISVTLTNQCKMYNYNNSWMAVMTDEWGNKYALQTASYPMYNDTDWQDNLADVVLPPGWTWEIVPLKGQMDHLPYMMDDGSYCAFPIVRDNQGNAWHQFAYATPIQAGLFANIECTKMDVRYTLTSGF